MLLVFIYWPSVDNYIGHFSSRFSKTTIMNGSSKKWVFFSSLKTVHSCLSRKLLMMRSIQVFWSGQFWDCKKQHPNGLKAFKSSSNLSTPHPPPLNIASWTSRCHLEARSLDLEYHSVWQGYQIITTSLWSGGGGLGLDVDFSFHRILNEPRIVLQICERSGSVRDHSCSKCKQLTIHKQTKTNRASRILRSEIINSITKDEFNGHKTILTSYCHIDSIWDGFRIN